MSTEFSRRDFLCRARNGIGALALAGLLAEEIDASPGVGDPMLPKPQHLPRKAKHCIFLFMGGGVSQVDTFDYKPALAKYANKRLPKVPGLSGEMEGFLEAPHRAIPSSFEFKQHGHSGRWISSLFPELSKLSAWTTSRSYTAFEWTTTITRRPRSMSTMAPSSRAALLSDRG